MKTSEREDVGNEGGEVETKKGTGGGGGGRLGKRGSWKENEGGRIREVHLR